MLAIWSGSSPAAEAEIKNGLKKLKSLDLLTLQASSGLKKSWSQAQNKKLPYLSTSDEKKVQELLFLLKNKSVSDILCTRGGYGNIRLLKKLDQANVSKHHQVKIWGYSDSTIIQNYFYKRMGWRWVHSPMLGSKSFHTPNTLEKKVWDKICKKSFQQEINLKILNSAQKKLDKNILLLGGNLASICSMIGTPWEPTSNKKYLLFIEDIKESAYKLDRMLQQLSYSRMFQNCQGILLGHFTDCPQHLQVMRQWSQEKKVFCAQGIKAGHQSPHLPMILGDKIEILEKNSKKIKIRFPELHL